jgi:hypothetical protein
MNNEVVMPSAMTEAQHSKQIFNDSDLVKGYEIIQTFTRSSRTFKNEIIRRFKVVSKLEDSEESSYSIILPKVINALIKKAITINDIVHQNARIKIAPLHPLIMAGYAYWTFEEVDIVLDKFLEKLMKVIQSIFGRYRI